MLKDKAKTVDFELEEVQHRIDDLKDESDSPPTSSTDLDDEIDPAYLPKERLFLSVYSINQLYPGICLGFVEGSLPILLVKNGAKLSDLGFLSLCSYPFGLKFLFGPLLDRYFSERVGKRMSYILPCLSTILLLSFLSAFSIDQWIQSVNLSPLSLVSFFMLLASAILMITSDGYLITTVARNRRSLMPMLKFSAQNIGRFLTYNLFIPLSSVKFCNDYIFSTPHDEPLVSFQALFILLAAGTFFYVLYLSFCSVKEPPTRQNFESLFEIIKMIRGFWTNKNLFRFLVFGIIWKLGFAPLDNYLLPACIRGGFSEADFINIQTMLFPVSIIAACLAGNYAVKGTQNQFRLFYAHIVAKIATSLLSYWVLVEYGTPQGWQNAFWAMTLVQALDIIQEALLFTSTGAFYARICDQKIGTTFLTVIFSVNNLGTSLPKTLMYYILTDDNWKGVTYFFWVYAIVILFVIIPEARRLSTLPLEEYSLHSAEGGNFISRGENRGQAIELKSLEDL